MSVKLRNAVISLLPSATVTVMLLAIVILLGRINSNGPLKLAPRPEKPEPPLAVNDFHKELNEYHDLKWKLDGVARELIDLKVEVAELKRANTNLLEQSTRAISGAYQAVQATYVHDDVLNGLNWRLLKLEPKPTNPLNSK